MRFIDRVFAVLIAVGATVLATAMGTLRPLGEVGQLALSITMSKWTAPAPAGAS